MPDVTILMSLRAYL
jgi:hypothetical protein